MLKVFRPNDWRYLGEQSGGAIAWRAALEEGFPKEKLAICRREVKLTREVSLIGSCERAHRFRQRPAEAVAEAEM